jgi:tetratricopeptide (TPR) repeat protein
MESIIRAHVLASEIAYYSQDYTAALSEATIGLSHAENCGYGKFQIDILLQLSKIQLSIPDYKTALSFARKALDKSVHPDCSYAWGEANGSHLCGICHKALGEYELASQRLTAALKIREKIQHPEVEETRKLLAELPPK